MKQTTRLLLALVLCCLVAMLPAQVKIGPLIGLRLPLWDSLNRRYWTAETRLDWEQSFGLRDNGDGTQTLFVKPSSASSRAYEFFGGFVTSAPEGSTTTRVWLNRAVVVTEAGRGDQEPVVGGDCLATTGSASADIWVGRSGVYFCTAPVPLRADATGWTWQRITWD